MLKHRYTSDLCQWMAVGQCVVVDQRVVIGQWGDRWSMGGSWSVRGEAVESVSGGGSPA